jgi:hypothetical protein
MGVLKRLMSSPTAVRFMARSGALALRAWTSTLRIRVATEQTEIDPRRSSALLPFWHEWIPVCLVPCRGIGLHTLISQSNDGELVSLAAETLGFSVIRGSSSRGGLAAVREMIRAVQAGRVTMPVAIDGPRGPRHEAKAGVVLAAAKAGIPIIPWGVASDRPIRFRSWDRMALPVPGRRVLFLMGRPIVVPADSLDSAGLERWRVEVQEQLVRVSDRAERELVRPTLPTLPLRSFVRGQSFPAAAPAEAPSLPGQILPASGAGESGPESTVVDGRRAA